MLHCAVWKNNVNAYKDMLLDLESGKITRYKHRCAACQKVIGDFETVLYCYLHRGTPYANVGCIHKECEATLEKIKTRAICRICGNRGDVDIAIPLRGGVKFFYHRSCLENVQNETTSLERINKLLSNRIKNLFTKETIFYAINTDPYTGLFLLSYHPSYIDPPSIHLKLEVTMFDGRLLSCFTDLPVSNNKYLKECIRFFKKGWQDDDEIERQIDKTDVADSDKKNIKKNILIALSDLKTRYDNKGRCINERPDSDFRMRFLLEYGCSMEGMLERALDDVKREYKKASQK